MGFRIRPERLLAVVTSIFARHGMSRDNAEIVAAGLVAAEADGAFGHGLFRIPGYVSTLESGWVDGRATAIVEDDAACAIIRVDACNGFAQPALAAAREGAIAKALRNGACIVAVRDCHHFSTLWADIEPFARRGLVALAVVNSSRRVVPWGGQKPVYGTNPMAFAVPRAGDPIVFDQASSAMAFGEIKIAAGRGELVPPGTGVDSSGRQTTDPAAIVDGGALLPFGGHKGSAIAMMVEVMAAALTGGSFSFEVDFSSHPGAQTPRTGELVILIDPHATGGREFAQRIEKLVHTLAESGQHRLPGDRRYANRRDAALRGIPIEEHVRIRLLELLAADDPQRAVLEASDDREV